MLKLTIALAAGLAAASPAAAKDKKPTDPNRKICRVDSATGSIMPKSTCHTAAEWAQIDATMRDAGGAAGDMRGHGSTRPGGFGGN